MIHDLLDAALDLEQTAKEAFLKDERCNLYRHGLRFERSGDSMAVFDGEFRIDRVDLSESLDDAFPRAVDMWLYNRYMAEVA